jgi:hypothetical protein
MKGPAQALSLIALLLATACKSGKPLPLLGRDLPPRSPERLLERVLEHQEDTILYYSARAAISVKMPEGNKSFKAQIRTVRDSATWMSVVPALGIEVARMLLTIDSLHVMDKMADQYFRGDIGQARTRFGLQPDLALLQSALLGKAIGVDPEEKYRSDREDGQYVLTSRERRRFIRAAEDIGPADTLGSRDLGERRLERTLRKAEEREAIVTRYWLDPDSYHVTRVQITDLARDQSADVRYELRGSEGEHHLPARIRITLTEPGRIASGTLELSRINLEGPVQMPFRIPDKFTPMP